MSLENPQENTPPPAKLSYPLDFDSQGSIESSKFLQLQARLFKGGLPLYTATPTHTAQQGEVVVVDTGTNVQFCSFVNGTWKCTIMSTTTLSTFGEIFIPAEAMNPTTTTGCAALAKVEAASNDVDYWVLDFDTTTAESAFFTIRMPDNWNASTVTFQFIWTNAAGLTTETVVWGIKGRCYADSDAIDQAYGSEITTTDTWLAQNDIHISAESTAVTPAGTLAAGQWAQFKITRKTASDNMTGDARLMGIRLKYGII